MSKHEHIPTPVTRWNPDAAFWADYHESRMRSAVAKYRFYRTFPKSHAEAVDSARASVMHHGRMRRILRRAAS